MSRRFAGTLKFGAKAIGWDCRRVSDCGRSRDGDDEPRSEKSDSSQHRCSRGCSPSPLLIVVGDKSERDRYDAQWLNGMVVNQTEKAYRFVQITYDLFDSTGAQIGTATANTRGLEPHGRWLFKTVISDHCTRFKLAKLDGY